MTTTRLSVECPNCHQRYVLKQGPLKYSNGAYIENVAGTSEMQRLLCPCRPDEPYKFRLAEKTRIQIVSEDESERTHFLPRKRNPV
jgi:hypothetical protein